MAVEASDNHLFGKSFNLVPVSVRVLWIILAQDAAPPPTMHHIQCRKTLIYIIQPNYITKKQIHTFSNHVLSWRQDDLLGDLNGHSLNPTFSTHDLKMRKLTDVSIVIESFILTVKLKAPIRTSTGDATRIINPTTWSGRTCVLMTASV